ARFLRPHRPALQGKIALIVDDGLATGATTEAAVRSAKNRQAAKVIVAAPVASDNAIERLQRVADKVIALMVDPAFEAVGRYYRSIFLLTVEKLRSIFGRFSESAWTHSCTVRVCTVLLQTGRGYSSSS